MTASFLVLALLPLLASFAMANNDIEQDAALSALCGYQDSANACPEGCFALDYDADDSNVTCLETTPGFYSPWKYPYSLPCSAGFFQPYYGSSQCFPCPAGMYAPNLAATECFRCPAGYYQPLQGQAACLQCHPTFKPSLSDTNIDHGNETLILFRNDTTVLYCGTKQSSKNKGTTTPTDAPSVDLLPSLTPSSSPTFDDDTMTSMNSNGAQDPSGTSPMDGSWNNSTVLLVVFLATVFVVSAVVVVAMQRPKRVQPTNDDDTNRESNLFNAFGKYENETLPQQPQEPAANMEQSNNFLSPPPDRVNNNHLVPHLPQAGPALVTPCYLDEELGNTNYSQEETKEPELSFDSYLERAADARIIGGSPEDVDVYVMEDIEPHMMDVNLESPIPRRGQEARSISYSQDSRDGEDYSSSYQFSPMSGTSQV